MSIEPQLSRPIMPGYGLPEGSAGPANASWERAERLLTESRNYWIATTGRAGRPHAMPVWGLWMDGSFIFSTGRAARKGRDLAANPEIAVHLESGDDVVILEGAVEELDGAAILDRYIEAYDSKYEVRPDPSDPAAAVYELRPRVAFTWLEADFVESAARWTFQ